MVQRPGGAREDLTRAVVRWILGELFIKLHHRRIFLSEIT